MGVCVLIKYFSLTHPLCVSAFNVQAVKEDDHQYYTFPVTDRLKWFQRYLPTTISKTKSRKAPIKVCDKIWKYVFDNNKFG